MEKAQLMELGIEMQKLMDGFGRAMHENAVYRWHEKKSQMLLPLFKDELIIEKEITITKCEKMLKNSLYYSEFRLELQKLIFNSPLYQACEFEDWGFKRFANDSICGQALIDNRYDRDYCFINRVTGKEVKIQKGTKVMRKLNLWTDDKSVIHSLQNQYSQLMNDKIVKGTLCLSIHPNDYLTVSENNCGWGSCFCLDGEYRASLGALMASPNTMVAYLKSKDDMELSNGYKWNSKKFRTLVSFADSGDFLHVGNGYPFTSESLNEAVVEMVNEKLDLDFGLQNHYESRLIGIETPDNMYNDAYDFRGINLFIRNGVDISNPPENDVMEVIEIANTYVCFSCGHFNDFHRGDSLNCADCDYVNYCEYCESYEDEDDFYEVDGMCVCGYCYRNEIQICQICGEPHLDSKMENLYDSEEDQIGMICDDCVNHEDVRDYRHGYILIDEYDEEDDE